ncbi:alpha/beta hydrolase [Nocardioides sp. WL0053]|uniref:Alpha/beta hydrolase n=1 Tax=Nocardioides jiangsuensis TaxID=2866161 RepID=A0ABS7RQ76_9ACTN|nr:alpha/beta hydrolase [Nocardioides jiangsuensis]MBY9076692.1 alpha/beta hydrolase [Nocardioides jiangsuensis]
MVLHPQAEAAMALWARGPRVSDPGFDVDAQRRLAREQAAAEPREDVARAEDVDADGVPCRLYLPAEAGSGTTGATAVVYLHGGGFVFGDLETHDAQSRRIANRTGAAVLTVHYRRPPEHRFPAAPDDVDTALAWLLEHGPAAGVDTGRPVVLGDSAGANLALVAALRHPGTFAAAVLVYPFVDPRMRFESYHREAGGLGADDAAWYWQQYAGPSADLADPDLAPIDSPLLGTLPPSLVQAAEHDPLVDEDVELARLMREAGVPTELTTYAGMVHGFWRQPAMFDAAEESLAEIADFLRRTV